MEIESTLKTWSKTECVRFAVWCAKRIQHLNSDFRISAAIEAAEAWLLDPSEANRLAARDAARAVGAAAGAAADAAAAAARAAGAADAARAAYAAYAAAGAADAAAAHAANAAARAANLTGYDLLQIYLSDQILDAVNA